MPGDPEICSLERNMIASNGFNEIQSVRKDFDREPPIYFDDKSGHEDSESLGPLPPKWEKAYTDNGEVYFIDHNSGTSHWLDPRLSKFQKKSLEDCTEDELPYGWEKISDPHYGTYFIDHVNRRTQYENPVIQAKRAAERSLSEVPLQTGSSFTRNPAELCGERFTTALLKSSRGLGFTIVGGDDNVEEFLQIKSIVPNGPAWLDGKLQMGDLLVYVNDTCVLGFKHHEMVSVFQSILPGETVVLEVCRGYPLPFDPNDPNTEVLTTIAVDAPNKSQMYMDMYPNMNGNYNYLDMPEDQTLKSHNDSQRLNTVLSDSMDNILSSPSENNSDKFENIAISIVKGPMGFGFTIADSTYGQKVKKILDRQRCKNLLENDILLSINSVNVRDMSHGDVVQVLKDCPRNQESTIHVQRGEYSILNSNGKSKVAKSSESNKSILKNLSSGIFRSKTPTSDIYSTQQKEVLPIRPKTPLVDTRVRSRTPLTESANLLNQERMEEQLSLSKSKINFEQESNNLSDTYELKMSNLADRMAASSINNASNISKPMHSNSGHKDFVSSQIELNQFNQLDYYNYNPPLNGALQHNGHHESCCCYECKDYKMAEIERSFSNDPLRNGKMAPPSNDSMERKKDNMDASDPYGMGMQNNCQWMYYPSSSMHPPPLLDTETCITLIRQESGFGFRIVGGTEEGSQVAVGHIVPGGAADLDGRICTGDEILSVDGQSVVNTSHHQVVQLMGNASQVGRVTLGIRRRNMQDFAMPQMTTYPYDVVVKRNENEGFGFVIISSINKAGSTIGRLIEGSPSERCGQLRIGDRILAVNHMDITHMSHGDIVNLIKESGYVVTLTIGLPLAMNKPVQQYIS